MATPQHCIYAHSVSSISDFQPKNEAFELFYRLTRPGERDHECPRGCDRSGDRCRGVSRHCRDDEKCRLVLGRSSRLRYPPCCGCAHVAESYDQVDLCTLLPLLRCADRRSAPCKRLHSFRWQKEGRKAWAEVRHRWSEVTTKKASRSQIDTFRSTSSRDSRELWVRDMAEWTQTQNLHRPVHPAELVLFGRCAKSSALYCTPSTG
jgi:hypothetical protein